MCQLNMIIDKLNVQVQDQMYSNMKQQNHVKTTYMAQKQEQNNKTSKIGNI